MAAQMGRPAARQTAASSAAALATSPQDFLSLLNTLLFLSFQIVQATRVTTVSKPRLCALSTFFLASHHQSMKEPLLEGKQRGCRILLLPGHATKAAWIQGSQRGYDRWFPPADRRGHKRLGAATLSCLVYPPSSNVDMPPARCCRA